MYFWTSQSCFLSPNRFFRSHALSLVKNRQPNMSVRSKKPVWCIRISNKLLATKVFITTSLSFFVYKHSSIYFEILDNLLTIVTNWKGSIRAITLQVNYSLILMSDFSSISCLLHHATFVGSRLWCHKRLRHFNGGQKFQISFFNNSFIFLNIDIKRKTDTSLRQTHLLDRRL